MNWLHLMLNLLTLMTHAPTMAPPRDAPTELVAALHQVFPHIADGACVERRGPWIAAIAAQGEREYGVPAGITLAVSFLESRVGCDRRSGGSLGTPIDAQHRNIAGPPRTLLHSLQSNHRVCGDWLHAMSRFRFGYCNTRIRHGYSPEYTLVLTRRLYTAAGLPLPEGL